MVKNKNTKVLYVGSNFKKFEKYAKKYFFTLKSARTSIQAFNLLKMDTNYALIICQFELGGNDGLFFHQKVTEKLNLQKTPFILTSQQFNRKLYSTCLEQKIADYFVINDANSVDDVLKRVNSIFYRQKEYKKEEKQNKNTKVNQITKYKLPKSKRIFDVIFSSILLLMALPLLLIIITIIKLE